MQKNPGGSSGDALVMRKAAIHCQKQLLKRLLKLLLKRLPEPPP
jgi:hypothetical protein